MANKVKKPKKLVSQLILEMKNNRGITFNYIDESVAANYLSNINNYYERLHIEKIIKNIKKEQNKVSTYNLIFLIWLR